MESKETREALTSLLKQAEIQGYVTFDDIMDCANTYSLPIQDFDWLTEAITTSGILIYDDVPPEEVTVEQNDNFYDYAQGDYDYVYRRIIELDQSLEDFVNKVRNIVPPQRREVDMLKYQVREGNIYARNRMIEMHLRLALKIALQRAEKYDTDVADTVGEGCMGLIIAVDKYDPDTNKAFGPYASMWILQNISRNQPTRRPLMYYPVHERDLYFSAYPILKEFGLIGPYESIADKEKRKKFLKKHFHFKEDQIEDILNATIKFESLEELLFEKIQMYDQNDFERIKIEKIRDAFSYDIEQDIRKAALRDQIEKILNKLSKEEKKILELRFGLIDGQEKTLEEVGSIFGVTRERIRQIETKALRRLKDHNKNKPLFDYLFYR